MERVGSETGQACSGDTIEFIQHDSDDLKDPLTVLETFIESLAMTGKVRRDDGDSSSHESEEATGVEFLPRGSTVQPENAGGAAARRGSFRIDQQGGYR